MPFVLDGNSINNVRKKTNIEAIFFTTEDSFNGYQLNAKTIEQVSYFVFRANVSMKYVD